LYHHLPQNHCYHHSCWSYCYWISSFPLVLQLLQLVEAIHVPLAVLTVPLPVIVEPPLAIIIAPLKHLVNLENLKAAAIVRIAVGTTTAITKATTTAVAATPRSIMFDIGHIMNLTSFTLVEPQSSSMEVLVLPDSLLVASALLIIKEFQLLELHLAMFVLHY